MKKFLKGFYFAFNGIKYSFKTQLNFRIHALLALLAIVLGFVFQLSIQEWLWVILAILLVLIFELINTAIETLVDLIAPDYNVKAGLIKDISAGSVLLSAILALIIGLIIFLPKIIDAL